MSAMPIPPANEPILQARPLSEPARLIDTFIAPRKTFTDLRRNASWWGPFLIVVVVSLLYVRVIDQKVGFRKVAENQIQLQPKQADKIERLPADQREKVMQQQTTGTKIFSYGIPVVALFVYAIFAGVLFATLKFAANADVKFKALFALIVYTRLPELLRALLATVSLLAGVSNDAFNIRNPVAVNPGYFVDPSGSPVLRTLLTSLDIITIWSLVLLAIGITCISKVKSGTAFAVVFGWFGFTVLVGLGFAAAFS